MKTRLPLWQLVGTILLTAISRYTSAAALRVAESALNDDTFLVVAWDADCAKPADVLAVAKAIGLDRSNDFLQAVDQYKGAFERLTRAGLASASLAYSGNPNLAGGTSVALCLRLAPGADRAKLTEAVRAEAGDAGLSGWDFVNDGEFIVLRPRGAAARTPATPARKHLFSEAASRDDKAVSVVFMPTEAMRKAPYKEPTNDEFPGVREVVRLLSINAKWLLIDLDLGRSPAFEVTARPKDAVSTGNVVDAFTRAATAFKSQTTDPSLAGLYGVAAVEGAALLDDDMARPGLHDSTLSFTAKGKALGGVAVMIDLAMYPLGKSLPPESTPAGTHKDQHQ